MGPAGYKPYFRCYHVRPYTGSPADVGCEIYRVNVEEVHRDAHGTSVGRVSLRGIANSCQDLDGGLSGLAPIIVLNHFRALRVALRFPGVITFPPDLVVLAHAAMALIIHDLDYLE